MDRMQKVIKLVRVTLRDLLLAIEGTIIMNEVGLRTYVYVQSGKNAMSQRVGQFLDGAVGIRS